MSTELDREVEVPVGRGNLRGTLHVPPHAQGVVVFAHGSGSGRFSPRNQYVAEVLHHGGLATLFIDLLQEEEAGDREKYFDINMLAERIQKAAEWLLQTSNTRHLRLRFICYMN